MIFDEDLKSLRRVNSDQIFLINSSRNKKFEDNTSFIPLIVFLMGLIGWVSSNSSFIKYCDNNIGVFSIAPPLVIALKSDSEE